MAAAGQEEEEGGGGYLVYTRNEREKAWEGEFGKKKTK